MYWRSENFDRENICLHIWHVYSWYVFASELNGHLTLWISKFCFRRVANEHCPRLKFYYYWVPSLAILITARKLCYWITDIHEWDVMHLVIQSNHITGHIFILISTYQVSSAWLECRALQRKKVKVWCADRGLNPGPFTCWANALTTELPTPLYFLCNPELIA